MRLIPILLIGATLLFGNERIPVAGKSLTRSVRPEHPAMRLFPQAEPVSTTRGTTRLLVLMVDFVADADTATTGNGKFLLTPTTTGPKVGSPPHDQEYYSKLCQSVGVYWNAASLDQFHLEYDIFPHQGAYSLPHEMSYYNPAGAGSDLMLERFIEYFQDVLRTADADTSLSFAQFDQIMVIHAGSDWQHDVLGNSPSDMPSFHIHVAPDKVVTVDGGIVIDNFANVPETITQDVTFTENNGVKFYSGYGVTNAVMAHEFGHNLGLVDLYSSTDNRPAVGYWDIMDSGGSVTLSLAGPANNEGLAEEYYYIEGAVPALPSAWSRQLLWGDAFRAHGYLKDITDFDLTQPVELLAAGADDEPGPQQAYMVRVPLSDTEYLLLENRQLDHDKDGPTILTGDAQDESRVVLYPTGWDNDIPDEYDFVLPGWFSRDNMNFGGGLVAWHIDDQVIYRSGNTVNGEWESNFDANTVNTKHYRRGVSMIEADGMDDIGYPYSLYWTGTPYEPFFPSKPQIDDSGFFAGWSLEPFNDSLSAATRPALETYEGDIVPYRIYDIDGDCYHRPFQAAADKISFRFGSTFFDQTVTVPLTRVDSLLFFGDPVVQDNQSSGIATTLPVISMAGIDLLQHAYLDGVMDDWQNPWGTQNPGFSPRFAPVAADWDGDGDDESLYVSGPTLIVMDDINEIERITCSEPIVQPPLCFWSIGRRIVCLPGETKMFWRLTDGEDTQVFEGDIPHARVAGAGPFMACVGDDKVEFQPWGDIPGSAIVPVFTGDFHGAGVAEPVLAGHGSYSHIYLPSDNGDIHDFWWDGYQDSGSKKLFRAPSGLTGTPSQLAVANLNDDGRIYLVFGLGRYIYAVSLDGSLAPGFPARLIDEAIEPWSHPRVVLIDGKPVIFLRNTRGGSIALDGDGNFRPEYALAFPGPEQDRLFYEPASKRLCYASPGYNSDGTCSVSLSWKAESTDPILWNGFRNGGNGVYYGTETTTPPADHFDAIAFPSPAKNGQVRFRVTGAQSGIDVKVFDIAGNLVFHKNVPVEPGKYQDNIVWDTTKTASGLYFGVVRSGSRTANIRIGVEN